MKLASLFVFLMLTVTVKGAWWAAAVQPVILGFGAILTAFNEDALDIELPFINLRDSHHKQQSNREL